MKATTTNQSDAGERKDPSNGFYYVGVIDGAEAAMRAVTEGATANELSAWVDRLYRDSSFVRPCPPPMMSVWQAAHEEHIRQLAIEFLNEGGEG
ncbi:MAG: hypothetical protein FWD53_12500 [Phycisphaerales bacterium]|nr:hypothetical protein [Phycisphaerales bacterium]